MRCTGKLFTQNLLHEVQIAIEAKPALASSSFKQRRAFLSALRADMVAHKNELLRANRHDCEAFTQQMRAIGISGGAAVGGAGSTPASPSPHLAGNTRGNGGGLPSAAGGTGTASVAGAPQPRFEGAAARGVRGVANNAPDSKPRTSQEGHSHAAQLLTEQGTGQSSERVGPLRTGEVLGPFYQSAFTSRPSHRQQLFPLRFDKVFRVIDYLLSQPDPIAVPPDCWLSARGPEGVHSSTAADTAANGRGDDPQHEKGETAAPPDVSCRHQADPNLKVCEISVPVGVVGILSRYRPRMLLDATAMGIFAGNALLLDGGASLYCTNVALMTCVRRALLAVGLPVTAVVHVESYDAHSRLTAEWLQMTDRVDMGLVCGPAKLYDFACKHSSIPLIRATSRSSSLFVHESASYDTALRVILNANRQAPGAANAVTTLIMHSKFPRYVELLKDLVEENVTLLGDYPARSKAPECIHEIASDEEYRGLSQGLRDFSQTLCIKTVDSTDQALFFLDLFGSKQSDGIIANDEATIATFCTSADSAVVLVNASTRLSSGIPLGVGPDLAIATSKMHCRGPFTLSAFTTKKFIVRAKREEGALSH